MKSEPLVLLSTIYSFIFCCDVTFHCNVTVLSEFNFPVKLKRLTGNGASPIKTQPDGKPKAGTPLLCSPQLAWLFKAALASAAVDISTPQALKRALSKLLASTPGVPIQMQLVPVIIPAGILL